MSTKPSFFAELQRRNVYRVGAMYAVAGWLLVPVATQVLPIFHVGETLQRIIVLAIIAGFPVALVLSWIYELTPVGIVKTHKVAVDASVTRHTGQQLNRAIIGVLLMAVLVMAAKIFWPAGSGATSAAAQTVGSDTSIAVLPFVNMSGKAANEYFSDGITEEILNAATQLPGLRVAAHTSAFQFKGQNIDLRKVGETLAVAYVLEGSVQRAGDEVRITAQLIDAHSGYHRWSGKFDRKLVKVFSIEDEIDLPALPHSLRIRKYRHGNLIDGIGALRKNVSAYDAAYVVLARLLGATRVTRDTRLAAAPQLNIAVLTP